MCTTGYRNTGHFPKQLITNYLTLPLNECTHFCYCIGKNFFIHFTATCFFSTLQESINRSGQRGLHNSQCHKLTLHLRSSVPKHTILTINMLSGLLQIRFLPFVNLDIFDAIFYHSRNGHVYSWQAFEGVVHVTYGIPMTSSNLVEHLRYRPSISRDGPDYPHYM